MGKHEQSTTTREKFLLVTKSNAAYMWVGTSTVVFKNGVTMSFNPDAEMFLFRKIENRWEVVFAQESATMVPQQSGKKK